MFSKKYQEELLKEKVDKLNQLDKIEFNQRQLYWNVIKSKENGTFFSGMICYYILCSLGLILALRAITLKYINEIFLSNMYFGCLIIVMFISMIIFFGILIQEIYNSKKQKQFFEENEAFLEERLKK